MRTSMERERRTGGAGCLVRAGEESIGGEHTSSPNGRQPEEAIGQGPPAVPRSRPPKTQRAGSDGEGARARPGGDRPVTSGGRKSWTTTHPPDGGSLDHRATGVSYCHVATIGADHRIVSATVPAHSILRRGVLSRVSEVPLPRCNWGSSRFREGRSRRHARTPGPPPVRRGNLMGRDVPACQTRSRGLPA